ncbi:reprolysin-like metallopeptidase [Actinokineospora xionganensis]|uniref:Reprolysin-like metallo-peptidase family M12B n=1 Tax=Actinokineospora xionganensis TaxID=2684470 RepID=A0ABR7LAD3_9PSEU|nr:zinc-dependent metalloprotease family protein [Actinokineospora xionganensis]MBC6449508.1 hypothetical protein [Actinokineospora xionganensis]
MRTRLGACALAAAALLASPTMAGAARPAALFLVESRSDVVAAGVANSALVRVDAAVVSPDTEAIEIPLGDQVVRAVRDHTEVTGSGGIAWFGGVDGAPLSDSLEAVTLIRHGDQVTGTVAHGGTAYTLRPAAGGGHLFDEVDYATMPPSRHATPTGEPDTLGVSVSVGVTVVRVLVAASEQASTVPDLRGLAELAIATANRGFANNRLPIRFELAGVLPTDYAERGFDKDLSALRTGRVGGVAAKRDEVKADVVSMLVRHNGNCGVGFIKATANTAFSVVNTDCARANFSLAHEIGHNFGADHDAANEVGGFRHGHGHVVPGRFRTIMSYACPAPCPRINYWSSPLVKYKGQVLGNAETSDNARVLRERAAVVAAFR